MYLERTIHEHIRKATKQFPVLLLTGPRQVGKTTCLQHLKEAKRNYVTLDDPLLLDLAKRDPKLFLQRFPAPVFIDEIQYAPELLPIIKMEVDKTQKTGAFWLTGSQQFHLMKGITETLAGRVGIVQLLGFSRRELQGQPKQPLAWPPKTPPSASQNPASFTLKAMFDLIWRGAFPRVALYSDVDVNLFYSSYVQTYLQRDVRALAKVGDEQLYLRFLRVVAARTGQLLNLTDLARDADISPNTAKSWLSILQTSGIVFLLEPYHTNVAKRLVKTPKLFFLDTGLAAYLTEWTSSQTLEAGAMAGAFFETWVFAELLKRYLHLGRKPPLYYYRDKDKKEIDVLVIQDGTIFPIEIKKTYSPSPNDLRHFSVLDKFGLKKGPGSLICLIDQMVPLGKTSQAIPAWMI